MKTKTLYLWTALLCLCLSNTLAQNLQWHKQFSGNLPNFSAGFDITYDAAGNSYVVGQFAGTINFGAGNITATQTDFFFAKYNANGALLYAHKVGANWGNLAATGVAFYSSGGTDFILISGYFSSYNGALLTANFDPLATKNLTMNDSNGDAFVAKYNSTTGACVWAKLVPSTQAAVSHSGKIAVDGSGNAYVTSRDPNNEKGVLRKYDANGNSAWTKTFTTPSLANDVAVRSNVIYVCGANLGTQSKPIAWFNSSGTQLGSVGSTTYVSQRITLDASTGIYIVGSKTLTGGYTNSAIEKYTTGSSSLIWGRYYSTGLTGNSMDIGLTGSSNSEVVVTGWFKGTVNFNNGVNSAFTRTSSGSGTHDNIFVARYKSGLGDCLWVENNTSNTSVGQSDPIALASNSTSFNVLGYVQHRTINLDLCGGTVNIVATNANNSYIARYSLQAPPSGTVNGPSLVCAGGAQYTVINLPQGATLSSWSATSNININPATGYAVPTSAYSSGSGQVTANISFGCGQFPITKTISWVGKPTFTSPTVDGSTYYVGSCHGVCPGYHTAHLTVNGASALDMSWNLNPGGTVNWQWEPYNSQVVFEVIPFYTQFPFNFVGSSTNQCGTSQFTFCFISGPNCQQSFAFSPNPATNELTLTKIAQEDDEPTDVAQVALYDYQQNTVYSIDSSEPKIVIPVSGLPAGQYYLQITNKKGMMKEKVIINK